MPTATPQLDYALTRKRRVPRALLGLTIAIVLAVPVYHYGPPLVRSITLRHHYARAAAYAAPPGQVVYPSDNPQQFKPPAWPALTNAFRMAPPAGQRFLLFLHARTTPAGVERLLILEAESLPDGELKIHVTALPPVPLTARRFDPRWSTWYVLTRRHLRLSRAGALRRYAARADPADRSRFTFDLDLDGQRLGVDAQLTDTPSLFDSVSVDFDLRPAGPADAAANAPSR